MRRIVCIVLAAAIALGCGATPESLQPLGQLAAPALIIALWLLVDCAAARQESTGN
jgi:hypothetical protein